MYQVVERRCTRRGTAPVSVNLLRPPHRPTIRTSNRNRVRRKAHPSRRSLFVTPAADWDFFIILCSPKMWPGSIPALTSLYRLTLPQLPSSLIPDSGLLSCRRRIQPRGRDFAPEKSGCSTKSDTRKNEIFDEKRVDLSAMKWSYIDWRVYDGICVARIAYTRSLCMCIRFFFSRAFLHDVANTVRRC